MKAENRLKIRSNDDYGLAHTHARTHAHSFKYAYVYVYTKKKSNH